ncbi:methyltransferase domain-containing protein [Winogradskyella sp. 3972H.M.0a.05]|uniref:class I SAM-dependent methyltransferase n=1 Tax=Winogradskyella sp. 3972H.M.0a.05 TaxID=2950277 RepID=UPI003398B085
MYKALKTIVRTLIPNKLFFKLEPTFRDIHYSLSYKGDNFKCTICEKPLKAFIPFGGYDKICPSCGSLSRDRRLWQIIERDYTNFNPTILDFSPSRALYRKLKAFRRFRKIEYITTDLSGNFLADRQYNITDINVEDEAFDVILCYHVLEHIIEDTTAMKELYRILKPNGTCLIQTPFKEGDIYEDYSIISPEDRLKHFGQDDHVRVYSVEGLSQRLQAAGFNVNPLSFEEADDNLHGFANQETVLVCRKGVS